MPASPLSLAAKPVVSLRELSRSIGDRTLWRDVNLQVAAGEFVAIVGESGVGKSSLLNLIAGLDRPTSGEIDVAGQRVHAADDQAAAALRRTHIGFVFQAFHVLPTLSVAHNVAVPLLLNGVAAPMQRVSEMLAAVGLQGRDNDNPTVLSGGELQRVALARALAHRPSLLLADEPTGNLDPQTAQSVLALLKQCAADLGTAIVMVTHSQAAAREADRVLTLTPTGLQPTPLPVQIVV